MLAAGESPVLAPEQSPVLAAGESPVLAAGESPVLAAGESPVLAAGESPVLAAGESVPRPPHLAFVASSTKCGGRTGRIYHVMHTTADVLYCS